MNTLANEIDNMFGFTSKWTFDRGGGCFELSGTINIDADQVDGLLCDAGLTSADRDFLLRFLMGHEKGHHLQEKMWPQRDYGLEHHVMEIEADLIGAWSLAKKNLKFRTRHLMDVVKKFDDAFKIAQQLGVAIGDDAPDAPHHPWAEQRELSLVRGPEIAICHPDILVDAKLNAFAEDIKSVAAGIKARGL